jgi:DHA1 family bicyclomycin/chloramphenicol resistance-like MFS transporter
MAIVPRLAGTASGIGVFLQLLLAGISTQGYGWLANGTVWPLIFVTGLGSAFVLIAGMLPWLAKRRENNFS